MPMLQNQNAPNVPAAPLQYDQAVGDLVSYLQWMARVRQTSFVMPTPQLNPTQSLFVFCSNHSRTND